MNNIRLHLYLIDRTTTVTIHQSLYHLLSVSLTGELNARATVMHWLSDQVNTKLGKVPKKSYGFIGKYVTDIIISNIADHKLYAKYETLLDGDQ